MIDQAALVLYWTIPIDATAERKIRPSTLRHGRGPFHVLVAREQL